MIINQIDNKKEFQVYIIINLLITIFGLTIVILSIHGSMTHDWIFINAIKPYFGLIVILFLFGLIKSTIKPAYIETIINEREITIRTFQPNIKNGLGFILSLRFQKHLKELKISQHEYNDYKLLIDKFGFHRILILQKITKTGIYESSGINISLLGQKKYSDLILSIDRSKGKINLN